MGMFDVYATVDMADYIMRYYPISLTLAINDSTQPINSVYLAMSL